MCSGIFISKAFIFSCLLYFTWSFSPHFCCRKEKNAVQLDDEGGRTFLRVLIHLIMHDYPPLLSGALHLLFKHFSQRAEVLQAFKQVWMGRVLSPGAFQRLLCSLNCCFLHDCANCTEAQEQQAPLAVCAGVFYSAVPPEMVISGTACSRANVGEPLRDPSGPQPVPRVWQAASPCQQWLLPVSRAP